MELCCLQFIDNQQDQLEWERYCSDHEFIYLGTPATFCGPGTVENFERFLYKPEVDISSDGVVTKRKIIKKPNYRWCRFHNRLPVDVRGDVYLCCIYPNTENYKISNLQEMSVRDIQMRRLAHPECLCCSGLRDD